MSIITDANGNSATIENGRVLIDESSLSALAIASEKGDAYTWNAATADIGTTDNIILVQNLDPKRKIYIESLYIWQDVASVAFLHFPAHATWTGENEVAITAVSLNRDITKVPLYAAYSDAQNATLAAVTTFMALHSNELATGQFAIEVNFGGSIILGYQDAIAADNVTEPGAFNATFTGYYK